MYGLHTIRTTCNIGDVTQILCTSLEAQPRSRSTTLKRAIFASTVLALGVSVPKPRLAPYQYILFQISTKYTDTSLELVKCDMRSL